ncbi:MAG: hypothetical protein IT462_03645 [Planctomycetes bacterium]|nr:hypothetical protein [Planctomycetota bacterium]
MAGSSRVPRPQGPAPSARKPVAAPKPAPEAIDMSDIELGDGNEPQAVAPQPAVKKSTRTVAPPPVVAPPPAMKKSTRTVAPPPARSGNTGRMVAPPAVVVPPPAKTGNTGRMVAPPPAAKTGNTGRMVAPPASIKAEGPPAVKTGNTARMVAATSVAPVVKKGNTGPVKPPSGRIIEAAPEAAPAAVKPKGNTQRLTAPKPEAPAKAEGLVRLPAPGKVEGPAPAPQPEPELQLEGEAPAPTPVVVKPKGNTQRLQAPKPAPKAEAPKPEIQLEEQAPAPKAEAPAPVVVKPKGNTQRLQAPKPSPKAADPAAATGHSTAVGLGTGKFDPLAETKLGASPVGANSTGPVAPVSADKTGEVGSTDAAIDIPADGEKKPEDGKPGAKKLGSFKPLAKGPAKPLAPLKAGGAIVHRAPVAPVAEPKSKLTMVIIAVVVLLVLGGGGFMMMSGGPTQLIPDGDWAEKTTEGGEASALLPKGELKMPELPAGTAAIAKVIGSTVEKGEFGVCVLAVDEAALKRLEFSTIAEQLGAKFKGAKKGDELTATIAGMPGTEIEYGNESRRAYVRFCLNEKKDRLYFLFAEIASPKRTVDVDKFFNSFKVNAAADPLAAPKEEPKEAPKEEPKKE